MSNNNNSIIVIYLLLIFVLSGLMACTACQNDSNTSQGSSGNKQETKEVISNKNNKTNQVRFDADSAYYYVKKQVDFGNRVPGSKEHKACADWLEKKLGEYTDKVMVQKAIVTAYTKEKLPMYNIIGSINPDHKKRILLCAHWDTRHIAEKDPDESKQKQPIAGANDGASGVGVLLEIARQLKQQPVGYGVDIIFFDVEDYGQNDTEDTYCLGSQYWGKNLHIPNYTAEYGILLDMVGAGDAAFLMEQFSVSYAANIVKKVWQTAADLGYQSYFVPSMGGGITDDHYYINEYANIPTINIIHYTPDGFGKFHHTHKDNMDLISKNTLRVVGKVVMTVLYKEDRVLSVP